MLFQSAVLDFQLFSRPRFYGVACVCMYVLVLVLDAPLSLSSRCVSPPSPCLTT